MLTCCVPTALSVADILGRCLHLASSSRSPNPETTTDPFTCKQENSMSETPVITQNSAAQGGATEDPPSPAARERSTGSLAAGLTLFAGVVLITVGVFQFFQGLA